MTVFHLMARISLDSSAYETALGDAKSKMASFGGVVKTGFSAIGKAAVAGSAVAAAGISALTKASVEGYAEYEQLVGGVDTLFKEASGKVQQYASEAYKNVGMSANDYMTNATAFSASLISSLGGDTEAAAEYANRAMVSMSDNANKMGTSLDSIVQTYQSLSRGNFAMLDNLKLGYGGTKAELERLIKDAATYTDVQREMGITVDESSMSFDNIINAIAVVQGHLGIAGATAAEAASTIEGSLAAAKAAWANLVTGIADENQDFDTLVNNFVDSVATAANNLLPRIEIAITGVAKLNEKIVPIIVDRLPGLLKKVVPPLMSAVKALVISIKDAILNNSDVIVSGLTMAIEMALSALKSIPQILTTGGDILIRLINGILESIPELLVAAVEIIVSLADFLKQSLPTLIPTIVDVVMQIVETLTNPDTLVSLIDAALAIIIALAEGIVNSLPALLEKADVIIANLLDALIAATPNLIYAAIEIILVLVKGILDNLGKIADVATSIVFKVVETILSLAAELYMVAVDCVNQIRDGFASGVEAAKTWGRDLIDNFIGGIKSKWNNLKDTVSGLAQTVRDYIGFSEPKLGPLSNFHTYAPDMMDLFAQGIKDNKSKITGELSSALYGVDNVMNSVAPSGYGGNNVININVSGMQIANDYDSYRFAEKVSQALKTLQIRDMRSIGGY